MINYLGQKGDASRLWTYNLVLFCLVSASISFGFEFAFEVLFDTGFQFAYRVSVSEVACETTRLRPFSLAGPATIV